MTIIEHLLRKNLVKFKEYNGILYSKNGRNDGGHISTKRS